MEKIKDFPYWITEDGVVINMTTHRILKPETLSGYLRVDLRNNRARRREFVHRLVAETFIEEIPSGYHVEHLDGNPRNNNINNLKISTPLENNQRRIQHGTVPKGSKHPRSLLTDAQRNEAIESRDTSLSLAQKFNVSKSCIDQIRWRARHPNYYRKRDYNGNA